MTEIKQVCLEKGIPLDEIFVILIVIAINDRFAFTDMMIDGSDKFKHNVIIPSKLAYLLNDVEEDLSKLMDIMVSMQNSSYVNDKLPEIIEKLKEQQEDNDE